jgi:hypothetical protein
MAEEVFSLTFLRPNAFTPSGPMTLGEFAHPWLGKDFISG